MVVSEPRVCGICGTPKTGVNCKPCMRIVARRYYERHRDVVKGRVAQYRVANAEEVRAKDRARYAASGPRRNRFVRTPIIRRAQAAVARAIENGTLIRATKCEQCGDTGRIEAAHLDYRVALDVRWLCQPCHRRWDAAQPKSREVF